MTLGAMVCEQPRGRRADTASAAGYHRNPVGSNGAATVAPSMLISFAPLQHTPGESTQFLGGITPIVESASPMANFTATLS